MHDYRKLDVWHRAHRLVLRIYDTTAGFHRSERYGLASQSQRSASSIPMNLAEGSGSSSDREFARFIGIAIASSLELEYQLLLARDLGYIAGAHQQELERELGEIRGMLIGLRRALAPPSPS